MISDIVQSVIAGGPQLLYSKTLESSMISLRIYICSEHGRFLVWLRPRLECPDDPDLEEKTELRAVQQWYDSLGFCGRCSNRWDSRTVCNRPCRSQVYHDAFRATVYTWSDHSYPRLIHVIPLGCLKTLNRRLR